MASGKQDEEILKEYKNQTDIILNKMLEILTRAQRKADDDAYKATLEKLRGPGVTR